MRFFGPPGRSEDPDDRNGASQSARPVCAQGGRSGGRHCFSRAVAPGHDHGGKQVNFRRDGKVVPITALAQHVNGHVWQRGVLVVKAYRFPGANTGPAGPGDPYAPNIRPLADRAPSE